MYNYIILVLFCFSFFLSADAITEESIFITKSSLDAIIFDGKWTFETEWKKTTLHTITLENNDTIYFRIAHDGEFIYAFFDVINDYSFARISDRVLLCLDTLDNQSKKPDIDDYCFVAKLGSNSGSIYQGGSTLSSKNYFKKINNPEEYIAIGAISDQNDRYSKIPHTSYEFKIPIQLIGQNDVYGIYLQVYDYPVGEISSWPNYEISDITKPNTWGKLISPDKSIPEFEYPLLVFSSLVLVILLTNFSKLQPRIKF